MTELERLARRTGLPLAEIARRCGWGENRATFYGILRGKYVPDTLRAASLAEVLGITQARLNALVAAAREQYRREQQQDREAVRHAG